MLRDKSSVAANVHRSLAQRFRITRIYMVTGLAFLGPAWFSLIRASEAITQGQWHDPSLLAAIHLFVVGYALTVVHGAILQIVPVVFQGRLHSIRLGYIQYVFMVLGSFSFPVGFLTKQWNIVAAGGISVLVAFLLLFWNLVQTARTLKKRTEALGTMVTFLFLLATAILGIGMALGYPLVGRATLPLHMVIGITGWFTTLVVVLSPRLMSFFVSSHYKKLRRSRPEFLLLIGMLAVVAGMALRADGTVTSAATGMLVTGWILYFAGYLQVLIHLYRHFRNRRRKDVEWVLKWIVIGLYGGLPVLATWAVVSSGFGSRWSFAIMLLFIFGFLQWGIAGYMAKILPFLRRAGRVSHGAAPNTDQVSGKRLPSVQDMLPQTPTVTALLGFAIAAILLTVGVLTGLGTLTVAGAIMGTVAWALYATAMVVMYRR